MTPLDQRPRYRPGGVSWTRLPWLLLAPLGGVLAAFVLYVAFVYHFYILLILPMFVGLGLAGAAYGAVTAAHCRNRWLAGAVGVMTGMTGYLGYYQLTFFDLPREVRKHASLPEYIIARIRTDTTVELGRGDQGEKEPVLVLNIVTFAAELTVMVILPVAGGISRAGRAYCRELGRWMAQETRPLPHASGEHLIRAIEDGTVPEFLAELHARPVSQMGCVCVLEYAEGAYFSLLDHPVYLTLSEMAVPKGKRTAARMGRLLSQVPLEPAEVAALRPLFPRLTKLLDSPAK